MDIEENGDNIEMPATPGSGMSPMDDEGDMYLTGQDVEISGQDVEYDPLSAGNNLSDGDEMESSPTAAVASADVSFDGPASPDVDDNPASPDGEVGDLESDPHSPLPIEGPLSPTGSGIASPTGSADGDDGLQIHSPAYSYPEGPASPTGSHQEELLRDGIQSPEAGRLSRDASPAGSHHSRRSSSRDVSPLSPASPKSPPASPKSRSVSPAGSGSHAGSRTGSLSRSPSPAGNRSRSGSVTHSRAGSASPARSHSRSRASDRSRSGSPASIRSRSGSPAQSRSRSVSLARSGSGSPARSHSGSPARSRSRSVSPARSGSGSPARSRSGSPVRSRSHSVSPARSGSGSPARSRSGSPARSRSRSVSPARSGSGSPARSRSGSPARSRSRSGSRIRSRSGSPTAERSSPVAAGDDEDHIGRRQHDKDGSDDGGSDKESAVGELIADIFGSSDEEEEFEGFGNTEVEVHPKKDKKKAAVASDNEENEKAESVLPELSDNEDNDEPKHREDFVSDFDQMLQRKKEEMRKRRKKRKDVDLINDNDDLIDDLIKRMREAAEEDRNLNQARKPAVKKLQMLPKVMSQLKKADLHNAFLDGGVLNAITDWLAPLPDKSLPHLQIREALLKQMMEFPSISTEGLKVSGIGKAVMYLYKHPKELRHNKDIAGKLINDWSRPIFNLTSNYKNLTREEREQRDYEQLPKKRRISLEGGATPRRDIDKALTGDEKVLRPGDPGYIYRARVPQPSNKDYVIRPKWNIEEKPKGSGKKPANKFEQHLRSYKRKAMASKTQRAVTMSIEGRNMAI